MTLSLCAAVRSLLDEVCLLQTALQPTSHQPEKEQHTQTLSSQVIQLQPQFQRIVTRLSESNLTPAIEQKLRPLQTEGHRQLKLAGISAMRLKTAKQAQTTLAMRSQVNQHLSQLQVFLESMAQELCNL